MSEEGNLKLPRKRIKLDEEINKLETSLEANEVAQLCYRVYTQLGKSGKPDPNKEHTVLACVVECQDNLEPLVVALATGTKCFPKNVTNRLDDIVDCHAESLLKRAFKRYLIELISQWINTGKPIGQFHEQVLKHRKYVLFVSQTPCGSISRWQGVAEQSDRQDDTDLKIYKTMGINRKPGRGDVCPKAGCIHKVAKWNVFGLQGRSLFALIGKAITLQRIVVGNCEQNQNEFISKMTSRLTPDSNELQSIIDKMENTKLFNFDSTSISIEFASRFRYDEFVRETSGQIKKKPTGSSIVAWIKENGNGKLSLECEVIASGRKLGANRKSTENKGLSSAARLNDTIGDVVVTLSDSHAAVVQSNQKANINKTSASKYHRPADLAVSDRALNQSVGQLIDRLAKNCISPDGDIPAEDNDRGVEVSENAKFDLDRAAVVQSHLEITHFYEHNWKLAKHFISIFKGWPTMP